MQGVRRDVHPSSPLRIQRDEWTARHSLITGCTTRSPLTHPVILVSLRTTAVRGTRQSSLGAGREGCGHRESLPTGGVHRTSTR